MKLIAFVFPGQGSQYVGMGRELFENFGVAKQIFEEADDALHFSISALCFKGPEEALKLTENTQPAVLTTSIATLKVLQAEKGIAPQLTAGHSLGEYSALVASGALTFSEAVKMVRLRGKFMQEAVPVGEGAMAAVLGMEREQVERLCEEISSGEVLTPANFNCPGQIVIAGHSKAVERAIERIKQEGKKAVLLPVSAPFHSPLMKPAGERLKKALEEISVGDLKVPVVTNVEAEINTLKDRVKGLLVAQVSSPVRWEESMRKIIEKRIEQVLEIGPGKVLSGLMKRIDSRVETKNLEDLQTLKSIEHSA
ncbi:MAG: [acyl-carrier-protein] S-malonyltransferase [Deltaproteobacteria bacterium CG_4_8_14_3_um_filter_45_9]|nr:MAG: [acyl-carrier-protein] S-malonyltransferase [Deltaproteobacteria bacterium CG03_land_8_20_14_0_80_45_14]PIX21550.1 MAG: [acyl-carrier-protein] S-malonyltransferase [Deltaproteobacteria bacterium CG_4_8_14_3_um_filter_45_9]